MAIDPRKVLPTKVNLIRLRREMAVIKRIRNVIEEKRDVLLHYIRALADEFNKYQREVFEKVEAVLTEYYRGVAEEGFARVKSYFESVPESLRVEVGSKVLFAVRAPTFRVVEESIATPSLPGDASPSLLKALSMSKSLVPYILRLLELEETLSRLLEELKSTQRLINALDYVIIPSYEEAVKFIKLILEDRMREDFVRLKLLKRRLVAAEEAMGVATQPEARPTPR